jgi:signal transduction histidine kinase
MKAVPDQAGTRFSPSLSALPPAAMLTTLERGRAPRARSVPGWLQALLQVPLPAKLVGANLVLLVAATGTALVGRHRELSTGPLITALVVAFIAASLLNAALVLLAVRPLRILEKTVDTIWHGDLAARVPISVFADRHVTRVARIFNILLDGLVSDRARTRRLATELINAADKERAAMSRELHDSAAQSLAALVMQLSVLARAATDAPRNSLTEQAESAKALATSTLEEIRLLAHTMHPRVLDDLGLVAALRRLARDTTEVDRSIVVDVTANEGSELRIGGPINSVLYRVAQEAVQNARRHAAPRHIAIRLMTDEERATLEIADDGRGFDPEAAPDGGTGIGLFTMRERVALVDGELHVRSSPGSGTSILASIPLKPAVHAPLAGFHA